ncbi:MFS transporter [Rubrivivax sp. A210]|uniref:MFS transporter n=1 Tax=Rubrivivax sp. A210 TaxID=2772301 RepID=UPI00191A7204|nr:MFS transporter [Rubrivivax sp. A210]CAD5371663.1 MFS transporter [Rubrivivax sp. A210]
MSLPATAMPRVIAAEAVSNFGSMLSRLAIPWLATLALQATPAQMAALLVADVAAAALAALVLGAWVDRHGRRAVMLLADGARAAVLGLLALAAWRGWLGMAGLLLAAAAGGACTVVFELARSAWMAQALAEADLPRRNAQIAVAGSLSETAAFALGGWLYQGLGALAALLVDAASYAASALCLRGVPEQRAAVTPATDESAWRAWRRDTAAGLQAIAARPPLRALAVIEGLLAFSMALTGTAYMIFVSRDIGLPTGQQGMVFAMGGLGAVLGAALAPRLGRGIGPGRTMALGLALHAAGLFCLTQIPGPGWLALALLLAQQIVGDAGHTLHQVHDRTLRQTAVPAELLARADAGLRGVGQAATLLGALAGAALGEIWPVRGLLVLALAFAAAAALWAGWRLAEKSQPVSPST